MTERDMMQFGYYQNMPGNMSYGNFGFQGMPGSLQNMGMMGGYPSPNMMDPSGGMDINTRLNNLENRVKILEQKTGNNSPYQQDDNSMYMI